MSEKSIPRQQAALVTRAKNEPSEPRDLAGARSGGKFVVCSAWEAYDAHVRDPNRRLR